VSYWGYKPYVSVAERQKKAEKAVAKAKKDGVEMSPIASYRGALAKTFWGKAWCDNLESYSDYANRLPRGRTYVRNGSVIDLKISAGHVQAQVMGSELYKVSVKVAAVPDKQWKAIGADCSGSIDSLVELLQGKLSTAVMERICKPETGLFPAPKEITLSCSCPDWASMCKHVAAVLYGVGARLDQQPELLFRLRRVDAKDLVTQAGAGLPKAKGSPKAGKVLDDSALGDVFGIEMAEIAPPKPVRPTKAAPAKAATGKVKPPAKPPAKVSAVSRIASAKGTAKAKVTKATVAKPAPVKVSTSKPKAVAKRAKPRNEHGK
jgi:uncharacterized Zn finger protein